MKVYDTLIIGSGYFSAGYALSRGSSLICEEHQICDVGFYLPMRCFSYKRYEPKTEEGRALFGVFNEMSLFGEREQNLNGFEFAFAKYIANSPLDILLKCRVISAERREDGIYDVTIHTNEGLSHVFARNLLDTVNRSGNKKYTVLFVGSCDSARAVELAFPESTVEPAFYEGRYALHIPSDGQDENGIKVDVYKKWTKLALDAKLLYMAPVFYSDCAASRSSDEYYANPIEAFEAGYSFAKEGDE